MTRAYLSAVLFLLVVGGLVAVAQSPNPTLSQALQDRVTIQTLRERVLQLQAQTVQCQMAISAGDLKSQALYLQAARADLAAAVRDALGLASVNDIDWSGDVPRRKQ